MLGNSEGSFGDELEKEIGMLLQERRRQDADDRERELNIYRSGSAPPTVEGSLSAVGGLFGGGGGAAFPELEANGFASEEELRSDPAYLSYYYSNVNLNPRLPPPLLSKEDWRFTQRLKGGGPVLGGIGDRRKANNSRPDNGVGRSLFSTPPGFDSKKPINDSELEKGHGLTDWGNDGLIGLSGLGLGNKQKSLTEIFQGDLGCAAPVTGHPSRPSSRNCFDENVDKISSAEAELAKLRRELTSSESLRCTGNGHSSSASQNMGSSSSYSYAAVLGSSLSRSNTPDPVIARAPSPCLTPIGGERAAAAEKRSMTVSHSLNNLSSTLNESGNLAAALSGLNLSTNGALDGEKILKPQVEMKPDNNHRESSFGVQGTQSHAKQHTYLREASSGHLNIEGGSEANRTFLADRHVEKSSAASASRSSYMKGSPTSISNGGGHLAAQYQVMGSPKASFDNYSLGCFSLESALSGQLGTGNLPPLYENVAAASAFGGGLASGSNMAAASESSNLSRMASQISGGGALQAPFMDPMYLQYLRTSEYAAQLAALNDASGDRNYLGNSYLNVLEMQKAYLGSLESPQKSMYNVPLSSKTAGSNHHGFYSNRAFGGGVSYPGSPLANPLIPDSPVGPGSPMRHNDFMRMRNLAGWQFDGGYSMNESFASSLLEEFKNNKTKCFELSEIAGHVVEFSADQYGSRFIQQKLETATIEEKNMVYQEIMVHALNLMTDVFGNYVIQKAIEVVDLDQKINMVQELDGHIMRCVRDQNGNHVIQKCIECIPEDAIDFIVSTFFDQVVTLSTHPYGCRVIQRVLEHCKDQNTQSKVMDEILGSVSMLAQDQYGNYVVQHVLEHGKPHERSAIIKELTGNIVEMSQQKFASNVVEKCLAFGSAAERQLMVDEMLGTTDENEPLQAMMKDQFGNYVVQKVLETCDDRQRELILSRIKVHLTALKKYTYGKHIVARVEKLVAAGERRMAAQSLNTVGS
ncbi:pumilio homolog 2-like isoform X2 [Punica granatum]|uniref:Pumilio homolog 2-like isoform X2 n=1 Tax=Punica granatum TaxID=22663 RepID=A0A218W1W6_PUNGR|nr:pumilio homolog 2-like isoform X2 [Punica granatum]OWM66755.1 hypothetical protein CDL15_Pgr010407 [Punica granatum]